MARRMSMPPPRQASVAMTRTRATSAATRGLDVQEAEAARRAEDVDDEEEDRVHNLTFDGVKEGSYMLCKRADDLLGHHARQAFREKAASMRGANGIYYFLKDLMKKFGADKMQKNGLTSLQIALQAHEFRKLVASDATFQSAIPDEHVDALFYRMAAEDTKVVRHVDFVEFCLLDHHQLRLLLFKFRKRLRKMRLTDNEITDTFRRLASTGASQVSSDLLHAAIARELDVVLTTGELLYLLQLMDLDGDGSVKVNDFECFVKDDRVSFDLLHPSTEHGVVDLKITMNEADEVSQRRDGFRQLFPALNDESNIKIHLWYKTAPREEGKSAITSIRYAPTSRDTELVSKGYTCLLQDINRGGAFGKHKYIWLSYVSANAQNVSEVIDLCLSSGEQDDSKDAKLWLPMHRGFKLVPGDLNERSSKNGAFLWIRRRQIHNSEELVDTTPGDVGMESPRATSNTQRHVDGLEAYVRQMLRRNCPVEQDGAINFARLFDEIDQKKARSIGRQAMHAGVEAFGIKMKLKDFPLVWDRINPYGKKTIDVTTFANFLEMTDSEIDEVVGTLQRSMTTKSTQQQQMPNYRVIFQSYNALGDGRLSRSDFQRLLANNHINFTNSELSKIVQRLDVNKDGIVDYSDFLRYVTGICDAAQRRAECVSSAAESLKTWAMEKQNKKLAKDGQIDSSTSWKLLRPKHGLLGTSSIDRVLRERNIRLDGERLQLLQVLIAPATNGEITQPAYHTFVNHQPRKIVSMVYDLKKVLGPSLEDGEPDGVYDRLNVEGNGRLSLVNLAHEINVVSSEKASGVAPFDLKDFVYLIQWTGADCGGDGAILIDRFLATIRGEAERRNMKHEFVTNYDSPTFVEGVKLLRDEMRRCAKTPDGKFDYRVPFRLFDKDKSGQIILSEFEAAIRELGVDKYLTDREVKSLMRRFDLNTSGGISCEEFLRFNVVEVSSKTRSQLAVVEPVLQSIVTHERLTTATVGSFCASVKRMFSIIDKDTHGVIPIQQFSETLRDMGLMIDREELEAIVEAFSGEDTGTVIYGEFCDALQHTCEQTENEIDSAILVHEPVEVLELLCGLYRDYKRVQRAHLESGKQPFDFQKAFGFAAREKQPTVQLSCDELKEVLWASGLRHPFLREELESIQRCFHALDGGFNVAAFCNFMNHGPASLFKGVSDENAKDAGVLDGYISGLQQGIQRYMATGDKDAEERLFRCFDEFDVDGSGTISIDEFVHVLHKAGLRRFLTPGDEELLLQFLDVNGDGVVSYKEFVDFAKHGEERLNAKVAHLNEEDEEDLSKTKPVSQSSRSAHPSPPRSPRPTSPSQSARSATPGKLQTGSPRALSNVVLMVAKLNEKLRPPFPFEKYFDKYRLAAANSQVCLVKARTFEKIMDKFLARLVEHNVAYSMHEIDADSLTRSYASTTVGDAGDVINFAAFLNDLNLAQSRAATHARLRLVHDSDSSDGGHGDLSCSSDEGESNEKRVKKVSACLSESIRRCFKTKPEQETLRAKVNTQLSDWEKSKTIKTGSGNRVFKIITKLGLRLKKKEAELLLSYLRQGNGDYDISKLVTLMNDQLGLILGDAKKPESAGTAQSQPTNAKKEHQTISPVLADKIYRCFIAAAQQNISGRRLLEKCDRQKSGTVTLLELLTVLRLMDCALTEAEQNEIKSAFGESNGSINYRLLVRQLTGQIKAPLTDIATVAKPHENRPAPSQIMPLPGAPQSVDSHPINKSVRIAPNILPPRPLSSDDLKRLDSALRPYFQELMTTRRIDTDSLLESFELYDAKGTGFVEPEAMHSVLRKYDIWPTDEMASNILSRFTPISSGRFDYVEFSTSLGKAMLTLPDRPPRDEDAARDMSVVRFTRHGLHGQESAAPKLPNLELLHAPAPRPEVPSSRAQGWNCPVCLHTQMRSSSPACEICGAQNPFSVQYETLLKCVACEFRNRVGTTHCDLCRLPLSETSVSGDVVPKSPDKSKSTRPTNLKVEILSTSPPLPAYDEGWLA